MADEMMFEEAADDEVEDFTYDEDSRNLVVDFMEHSDGQKALRDVAEEVGNNYDTARASSDQYRLKTAEDWRLYIGDLPAKDFPYENCANMHVPIMMENISRLSARLIAELFGDWSNVFGVTPVGDSEEAEEFADVLTLHGNWQLREQIKDFSRQMDRAVTAYLIWGDVTCHSYWDESRGTNMHEVLTPDDFVIPFVHLTTQPDYSDVPYYVKILRWHRHQIENMRDEWYDVDNLLDGNPPSWEDGEMESPLRQAIAETTGIEYDDEEGERPYVLLHYEGWMTLPNQIRQRFVQVIMDHSSKTILKMTIHEEPDWRDRDRYDREQEELDMYSAGVRMNAEYMGPEESAPVAPSLPKWMNSEEDEPAPMRSTPIHMFAHGVCMENMLGSLGLSFGRIQADFNRAANTMTNQFIDSGTLANCWVIVTTDLVDFETPFEFSPGKVNKASGVSGQELKDNMIELKPAPANPQLMQMVDKIFEWAASSIQSPNVLSGEPGKSGETYRGHAQRIEQATKQLSVLARKFATGFLAQVLRNNAQLNSVYMPDLEMISVINKAAPGIRLVKVSRDMYAQSYDVEIRADLQFTSRAQKIAEKAELVEMSATVPALANNAAFAYRALRQLLEARGDREMIATLGPPPPNPEVPMGTPPPPEPGAPREGGAPPPGGEVAGAQALPIPAPQAPLPDQPPSPIAPPLPLGQEFPA